MYTYNHTRVPLRQLIFLRKSDCLGCALLCCLFDLACFLLPSSSLILKSTLQDNLTEIETQNILLHRSVRRRGNSPPSKNPSCTNSSAPSCSSPTATIFTLLASRVGRSVLSFTAPSRQNSHPNRRRNMITTVESSHSESSDTF